MFTIPFHKTVYRYGANLATKYCEQKLTEDLTVEDVGIGKEMYYGMNYDMDAFWQDKRG
jgi:hypothetical protein